MRSTSPVFSLLPRSNWTAQLLSRSLFLTTIFHGMRFYSASMQDCNGVSRPSKQLADLERRAPLGCPQPYSITSCGCCQMLAVLEPMWYQLLHWRPIQWLKSSRNVCCLMIKTLLDGSRKPVEVHPCNEALFFLLLPLSIHALYSTPKVYDICILSVPWYKTLCIPLD
jgi:hypothetical protein